MDGQVRELGAGGFQDLCLTLGFSVIPIRHPETDADEPVGKKGKRPPSGFAWREYQNRKPSPQELEQWDGQQCNVGVVTGKISNLVVIDIDDESVFDELATRNLELPTTGAVKTARGWHYYFRHPGGTVGNRAGLHGIRGLDIRGDGGYVVGPGSMHESGVLYEIEYPLNDLAPLPTWVCDAAAAAEQAPQAVQGRTPFRSAPSDPNRYAEAALRYECDAVAALAPDSRVRNQTLNRAAFSLGTLIGAGVLNRSVVEGELWNAAACCGLVDDPNDGPNSVRATIRSGVDAGIQHPRNSDPVYRAVRNLPRTREVGRWVGQMAARYGGADAARHALLSTDAPDEAITAFDEGLAIQAAQPETKLESPRDVDRVQREALRITMRRAGEEDRRTEEHVINRPIRIVHLIRWDRPDAPIFEMKLEYKGIQCTLRELTQDDLLSYDRISKAAIGAREFVVLPDGRAIRRSWRDIVEEARDRLEHRDGTLEDSVRGAILRVIQRILVDSLSDDEEITASQLKTGQAIRRGREVCIDGEWLIHLVRKQLADDKPTRRDINLTAEAAPLFKSDRRIRLSDGSRPRVWAFPAAALEDDDDPTPDHPDDRGDSGPGPEDGLFPDRPATPGAGRPAGNRQDPIPARPLAPASPPIRSPARADPCLQLLEGRRSGAP